MKIFLTFFFTLAANGQWTAGFVKTGAEVVVFGEPTHYTQIFINEVPTKVIPPSGNTLLDFATRVHNGSELLSISARVCEGGVRQRKIINFPPAWAADPNGMAGANALTEEYLGTSHTNKELETRVKAIKKAIHGRPGEQALRKGQAGQESLEVWLKSVEKFGLQMPGISCLHPSLVKSFEVWNGAYNTYGFADRRTFMLHVEPIGPYGYQFRVENPTQRAYSH